jgi:prepilin-type N-terminal cleavage/methylation domain-containing protein
VRLKHFSIPVSLGRSSFTGTSSAIKTHLSSFAALYPRRFFREKNGHKGGYTLIELIVVLILLGLMFGLTVPRFRQAILSDSLDATALRFIGLVQGLRERAISEQVAYVLHIDIRDRKIWSYAGSASEEELENARGRAYKLPADVRIEDIWSWSSGKVYEEATIRFSRKGYIEQSMIHLQAEDGRRVSLELTPFVGSIITHEGYVDLNRG